jgi:hypothetical protein
MQKEANWRKSGLVVKTAAQDMLCSRQEVTKIATFPTEAAALNCVQ